MGKHMGGRAPGTQRNLRGAYTECEWKTRILRQPGVVQELKKEGTELCGKLEATRSEQGGVDHLRT